MTRGTLMNERRRAIIKSLSVYSMAVATGLMKPLSALAVDWEKKVFELSKLDDVIAALGGNFQVSDGVVLVASEIAENGAVVPISVESKLPNTDKIAILIENNPNPLSARFTIHEGTDPEVKTRLKMAGTSNVHAIARSDGKWFMATKEIKVTLGGCGG